MEIIMGCFKERNRVVIHLLITKYILNQEGHAAGGAVG